MARHSRQTETSSFDRDLGLFDQFALTLSGPSVTVRIRERVMIDTAVLSAQEQRAKISLLEEESCNSDDIAVNGSLNQPCDGSASEIAKVSCFVDAAGHLGRIKEAPSQMGDANERQRLAKLYEQLRLKCRW